MPTLPPAFLRLPWRGLEETWPRDEKGGAEEARVTEEFRNDRRPVASLTDDALLHSRLQAQKDGTAVMDSKWLEIVGRCHRTSSFLPLPLLRLSLSPSRLPARNSRHAMYILPQRRTGVYGTSQDSLSSIFCALELTPVRDNVPKTNRLYGA